METIFHIYTVNKHDVQGHKMAQYDWMEEGMEYFQKVKSNREIKKHF